MYGQILDCGTDKQGRPIRLIPPILDHMPACVRWMADPEVTKYLNTGYAQSLAQEEAWITKNGDDPNVIEWAIEVDDTHIGMAGIHGIDWVRGHGTTGIVIGEKEYWGCGIATAVMRARATYAFEQRRLVALYTEICAANPGSLGAAQKAGYRRWGIRPYAYWVDGHHLSTWCGVLDKPRWARLRKQW